MYKEGTITTFTSRRKIQMNVSKAEQKEEHEIIEK